MSSLQKFHRRTQPFKVNALHTGTVSISGTANVGSVLTATNNIADADGLGTFAYQWKRSGSDISGATSSTYTVATADISTTITVTITYTDSKGFIETETSAATISVPNPPPELGSGNDTKGYYMGLAGDGTSYMYVAPISTEVARAWANSTTVRGTTHATDGISNTNTLYAFGSASHPAAYYAKSLTTGGYNTWYLPAKDELTTLYNNRLSLTTQGMNFGSYYWASTEINSGANAWVQGTTGSHNGNKLQGAYLVRAVRRV